MKKTAALLAAALLFPASTAHAAPATDGSAIVYCHDTARALVQRVRLRHCAGQVISSARAAEIQARIEAERRSRQTRALTRTTTREQSGLQFKSAGAAFAVNRQGSLLTSAHVVRGCAVLEARKDDSGTPHRARVTAMARDSDLALLRIGIPTPDILRFSAQAPTDGTPLALIGYPAEGMIRRIPRMTPVLTSHAVSNPAKFGLIGVAGDVRRGNSGGPALDSQGRAVGVLKAKINTVAAHRLTGRVLTNLGVIVETGRILRFLDRSRTRYSLAGAASEKSGRALFEQGRRAVYRIDCLVRG